VPVRTARLTAGKTAGSSRDNYPTNREAERRRQNRLRMMLRLGGFALVRGAFVRRWGDLDSVVHGVASNAALIQRVEIPCAIRWTFGWSAYDVCFGLSSRMGMGAHPAGPLRVLVAVGQFSTRVFGDHGVVGRAGRRPFNG